MMVERRRGFDKRNRRFGRRVGRTVDAVGGGEKENESPANPSRVLPRKNCRQFTNSAAKPSGTSTNNRNGHMVRINYHPGPVPSGRSAVSVNSNNRIKNALPETVCGRPLRLVVGTISNDRVMDDTAAAVHTFWHRSDRTERNKQRIRINACETCTFGLYLLTAATLE